MARKGQLPTDVRRKLEEAVEWVGARQPFLAECMRPFSARPDGRVTIVSPDPGHESLVVNPAAIRDLDVATVAGALVGAYLAAPGLTGLSEGGYREFLDAVDELWDGYLEESGEDGEDDDDARGHVSRPVTG